MNTLRSNLKTLLGPVKTFGGYQRNKIDNISRTDDKIRVDDFRVECFIATENVKNQYLNDMGQRLVPIKFQSSSKGYWKILSKLINTANNPRIPPILYENTFVVNCKEKACLFNEFLLQPCKPSANNIILPEHINYKNELTTIVFSNDDILSMIYEPQQISWV